LKTFNQKNAPLAPVAGGTFTNSRRVTMNIDELTAELKKERPEIEELHLKIINHACHPAQEKLSDLGRAAQELLDQIYQQDFMNIWEYESTADPCPCAECRRRVELYGTNHRRPLKVIAQVHNDGRDCQSLENDR
jgi:hypothetical protein